MNLSNFTLDQQAALTRLYEWDATLLICPLGFGKTVVAQTAAQELLADGALKRVLIVAPPKVLNTWAKEHQQWEQLGPVTVAEGTPDQRTKKIIAGGSIVAVSIPNLPWLVESGLHQSFDGLIIDEVSKFKAPGSKGVRALRRCRNFTWRVGLSATPLAEAPIDAYAQALVLDRGERLGTNFEHFKADYFYATDYQGYKLELKPGAAERMIKILSDLIWMPDSTEYQDRLPVLEDDSLEVTLTPEGWRAYEELANTMVLEAQDIEAVNEAVLAGKLQQVASGFVYDETGAAHWIHDQKVEAVRRLVERLRRPVIIVYQFREELARLQALFPGAVVLADSPREAEAAWNAGEVDVLLIHPRSAGHGLNLQHGGSDMIFMGPVWSADQWAQTIGRIWRQGQPAQTVHRYMVVCQGTVDGVIVDRLASKAGAEGSLMAHIRKITKS